MKPNRKKWIESKRRERKNIPYEIDNLNWFLIKTEWVAVYPKDN